MKITWSLKSTVFWVVMPHSSETAQHFGENITSIFRVKEQAKHETSRSRRQAAGFLLGLLLKPEDGGDMFLQNVRLSPSCMELQPTRLYSSQAQL
jgi:hypothetical protein